MVFMPVMKQWYIICGVVCIGIVYLCSLNASDKSDPGGFRPGVYKLVTSKAAEEFIERNKHVQKNRIETIRNACRQTSVLATSKYNGQSNSKYYFSPSYNFYFCKVPKCGSTFWTQAFEIMNNGIARADEVFTKTPQSVHLDFKRSQNRSDYRYLRRAPVIFVARNPYSRLFSAYIDKLYLPQFIRTHIDIQKFINKSQTSSCPFIDSFETFLEYAVSKAFSGKILNKHWAPITSLCRPCEYNKPLLIKQETFWNDVEYALKFFHVDKNEEEIILDKLHGQKNHTIIPSKVKGIYKYATHNKAIKCFGYHGIAERIWRSFQIQGYLDDNIPFPEHIDISDLSNASYLSEMIMNDIATHPMSRDAKKAQRRAALVDAYSKVNKETIKRIQQVYKVDFAMFNYSEEPPLFD